MRRILNTIAMLCVCSAVLATVLAPTASATWGRHCSAGNKHHCYGIAEWEMNGNGNGNGSEEVKGISGEIATDVMSVPLWESHDVVTNEMWLNAPEAEGGWAEDGQLAGYDELTEEGHEVNGYSLHPFYAYNGNNGGEFTVYVYPGTVAAGSWQPYSEEDPHLNGYWCAGFGFGTAACKGGYPEFATDVQVGMEAGDERQPENAGQDHIIAQYTDGTWHTWPHAEYLSIYYNGESEAGYICAANYGGLAPGYTQWGTPSSSHPC